MWKFTLFITQKLTNPLRHYDPLVRWREFSLEILKSDHPTLFKKMALFKVFRFWSLYPVSGTYTNYPLIVIHFYPEGLELLLYITTMKLICPLFTRSTRTLSISMSLTAKKMYNWVWRNFHQPSVVKGFQFTQFYM